MLPTREYINLYHRQWGCNVIPLRYKSKKPALHQWQQWQSTRVSDEQIREWGMADKFGNIGLVCGDISRMAVLDIDNPAAVDWLQIDFNKVWQAGAAVVQTGGGYHIYMRTNQHVPTRQLPRFGVELRANGAYVLAPPSIHPSGRQYHWYATPHYRQVLQGKPPAQLRLTDVHTVWRWVERTLYEQVDEAPPSRAARYIKPNFGNEMQRDPPCITKLKQGVRKGARNNAAYALANFYKQQGKSYPQIVKLLQRWNGSNAPPLGAWELRRTAQSAFKRENDIGCTFMRNRLGVGHACQNCPVMN